jgi:hypothetical protein
MFGIWNPANAKNTARWHVLVPNFEVSTSAFYARVRELIDQQRIPDLDVSEVTFSEGGAFSARRRYLRLRRERIIFDFCSAPFGTSWFFSCRLGEIKVTLKWWEAVVILALVIGGMGLHGLVFGWYWGAAIFVMNIVSALFLLNSLVATGQFGLDAVLLNIPIVGAFYEYYLRGDTYYRDDTRRMYCVGVDQLLRSAVEEFTSSMPEGSVLFQEEPAPAGILLWDRVKKGLKFPWLTGSE